MQFKAEKQTDFERKLLPEGTHVGRLYSLIEIGTRDTKWGPKHFIRVGFEFGNELAKFDDSDEQKPFVLSKEITSAFYAPKDASKKSNLVKLVEALTSKKVEDGDVLDPKDLLDGFCLIKVIHNQAANGNTYANIDDFAPLVKGMDKPKSFNENVFLTYVNWDSEKFNELPDFIKKRMQESQEFEKTETPKNYLASDKEQPIEYPTATQEGIKPEDIPF